MNAGREKDNTSIFFADATSGVCDRLKHREARRVAESLSLEKLELPMQRYGSTRSERLKSMRVILSIGEYPVPDMTILAYRGVFKNKKQRETQ